MKPSFPMAIWGGILGVSVAAVVTAYSRAAEPVAEISPLAAATQLFQQGKYAEAEEAFANLPADDGARAALGTARCQEAVGQRETALATLQAAQQKHPTTAAISAELARLALARGDYAAAEAAASGALKLEPENTLALWARAELHAAAGQLAEATAGYESLVKQFNGGGVKDPERLRWIGLAAAEFARWNRLSDQFGFLVNEFYPDLAAADPTFWQAHYEAGRLFAEKYNSADANRQFAAALALNPNAAEVHVALGRLALEEFELGAAQARADRALEINPQLLAAWHLKADIHLANFEPRACVGVLSDALKLQPNSEETLGRMAAASAAIDGVARTGAETRFGKLAADVAARNPHCGVFFETVGDALDRLRRWPAAARNYEEATARMPQLIGPRGKLGMVLMRLGDEARAKQVLDAAFEADPFNVRVNNTLKVLEVLADYETFETEHFRIKYDAKKDKLLARYMGAWLEEAYGPLVRQMRFEPPEKSLFEVFSSARNTDGHGWFSARMVGLPHIHPIGACAGKMVALQSPSEGQQRFNWARVVKHEFVHVLNLQQTDFNIPHWFTEALAVSNEGYPRPRQWTELLVAHAKKNKLLDLETINSGFIRPHSSDEWTLAYCQAQLYAQYMLERFGDDAVGKMLAAYADNLTTPEAIARCFSVDVRAFETGYRAYVDRIIVELPPTLATAELSLVEAQKQLAENPKDAASMAALARAQLARKNYAEARRLADAALAIEPRGGLASYVRARLHLLLGENSEALARLEQGLDREHPQENLLALLAGLKLKAGDYAAAAELYQLGAKHDPMNSKWQKSLAAVYVKSGQPEQLAEVLAVLAAGEPDDLPVRKKLAQLALAKKDFAAADRWALEALRIQVMDSELHQLRARALDQLGQPAAAADEYAALVELDPENLPSRLALARMHAAAGQKERAKAALEELLAIDPNHPGAKELLEKLE
jgi:cellulose synthase operon protein C